MEGTTDIKLISDEEKRRDLPVQSIVRKAYQAAILERYEIRSSCRRA